MITIYNNKNGFIISGHANYAPKGQDIVCSAISTLAQSVCNALQLTGYEVKKIVEDGLLEVLVKDIDNEAKFIMLPLFVGAEQIALQYPGHVEYEESKF